MNAAVNSALWAAYGDALGFISELVPNEATLARRIGQDRVDKPIPWRRKIGGQFGVEIELPAGAYSDDTQLRLSTGRAIRGSGRFDVESFSKIELPVFLAYGLGVGRGTRAAAAELAKRPTRWSNNFFDRDSAKYLSCGGNGAAMRVQPHVWADATLSPRQFLGDVFINAICTHGHPRGFMGACLHALALAHCLETARVPDFDELTRDLEFLRQLPGIVRELPLVGDVWLPAWEGEVGHQFDEAVAATLDESLSDLARARTLLDDDAASTYRRVTEHLGGLVPHTRGAGMTSAVLASTLAHLFRDDPLEGLICGANLLGSDTDTIASMAGALLGATVPAPPPLPVMDSEYIASEAKRLGSISAGSQEAGFAYPDLLKWAPPKAQVDAIGTFGDSLAVAGLGPAHPIGEPTPARGRDKAVWQWLKLDFGQTVFARRRESPRRFGRELLPGVSALSEDVGTLFDDEIPTIRPATRPTRPRERIDLDAATRQVINSNFDERLIGRFLLSFSDSEGIDYAVAFAAIVAKARVARRGRTGSNGS